MKRPEGMSREDYKKWLKEKKQETENKKSGELVVKTDPSSRRFVRQQIQLVKKMGFKRYVKKYLGGSQEEE